MAMFNSKTKKTNPLYQKLRDAGLPPYSDEKFAPFMIRTLKVFLALEFGIENINELCPVLNGRESENDYNVIMEYLETHPDIGDKL